MQFSRTLHWTLLACCANNNAQIFHLAKAVIEFRAIAGWIGAGITLNDAISAASFATLPVRFH